MLEKLLYAGAGAVLLVWSLEGLAFLFPLALVYFVAVISEDVKPLANS